VISHPHVRRGGPNPFPNIDTLWSAPAFEEPIRRMLDHTGEAVGRVTSVDPATGRLSQFLFTRFKPANWVFVAVIPVDGG